MVRSGFHAVVFALHSVDSYTYECTSIPAQTISLEFFENEIWYIRLILEGEDRIAKNMMKQEQLKTISYSAYVEDWEVLRCVDGCLEQIIMRENIEMMLSALTDKQREINTRSFLKIEISRKAVNCWGLHSRRYLSL